MEIQFRIPFNFPRSIGDEDQHIHYDGWQVSNQCMALVRDDCLVPTIDDPALGYVKESSPEQFVPDVFFKASLLFDYRTFFA